MKKILITGGAGFIGYHLANFLAQQKPVKITLVDNLFRGKMDADFKKLIKNPQIKFLNLDLLDLASYKKIGRGYDQVYHLAAVNGTKLFYEIPQEVLKINTLALVYMLEWFKTNNRQGKFCFTSSNEAYAGGLNAFNKLPIPTPEAVPLVIDDPYNPRWSYAATKLVGELFVIHYAKAFNFRALVVRPHNFYGPRAGYGHVIPELSARILKREDPLTVYGGNETRTFCYIDDAVRAMTLLMDSPKTDQQPIATVHIGNTDEIKIIDLARKMFKVSGWQPHQVEIGASPQGSVRRRLADVTKLEKLTGWQPIINLEQGLKLTFDWYKNNPKS